MRESGSMMSQNDLLQYSSVSGAEGAAVAPATLAPAHCAEGLMAVLLLPWPDTAASIAWKIHLSGMRIPFAAFL